MSETLEIWSWTSCDRKLYHSGPHNLGQKRSRQDRSLLMHPPPPARLTSANSSAISALHTYSSHVEVRLEGAAHVRDRVCGVQYMSD